MVREETNYYPHCKENSAYRSRSPRVDCLRPTREAGDMVEKVSDITKTRKFRFMIFISELINWVYLVMALLSICSYLGLIFYPKLGWLISFQKLSGYWSAFGVVMFFLVIRWARKHIKDQDSLIERLFKMLENDLEEWNKLNDLLKRHTQPLKSKQSN